VTKLCRTQSADAPLVYCRRIYCTTREGIGRLHPDTAQIEATFPARQPRCLQSDAEGVYFVDESHDIYLLRRTGEVEKLFAADAPVYHFAVLGRRLFIAHLPPSEPIVVW
jgi:hypothetical protein